MQFLDFYKLVGKKSLAEHCDAHMAKLNQNLTVFYIAYHFKN